MEISQLSEQHKQQVLRHNRWWNKSCGHFRPNSSVYVKKLMDSFAILIHLFSPLPTNQSCITAIYAKNKAGIEKRCSLQIRNANSVSISTSIALHVWILTEAPTAVLMGRTLICPEKVPRFIKTQTPIHILCNYQKHAVPHLNIFTYHHDMKSMQAN